MMMGMGIPRSHSKIGITTSRVWSNFKVADFIKHVSATAVPAPI